MESDGTVRTEAAAQLDLLRADRERICRRMRPPWWYDPALATVVFLAVASTSLRGVGWWQPALDGVALIGLAVAVAAYRRRAGAWVNGMRAGRTRRAVTVWLVLYALVVALGAIGDFLLGWRGATVVAGAVLAAGVFWVSRWWGRLYAAELRELG